MSIARLSSPVVYNEDLRSHLTEILKYMPYEESEDLAISLLEREQDIQNKTFIVSSLCDMFSLKATTLIKELIETRRYDPMIMSLADHLIPIYVYHNQDVDWSPLEQIGKDFHDTVFKESLPCELQQQLRRKLKMLAGEDSQETEQVQEQPAPLKEKKAPILQKTGKAARKRAKKRKKKKRS